MIDTTDYYLFQGGVTSEIICHEESGSIRWRRLANADDIGTAEWSIEGEDARNSR